MVWPGKAVLIIYIRVSFYLYFSHYHNLHYSLLFKSLLWEEALGSLGWMNPFVLHVQASAGTLLLYALHISFSSFLAPVRPHRSMLLNYEIQGGNLKLHATNHVGVTLPQAMLPIIVAYSELEHKRFSYHYSTFSTLEVVSKIPYLRIVATLYQFNFFLLTLHPYL